MLFSYRNSSYIIIVTLILVPSLILGFRVINLLIQYSKILKTMSNIFKECNLLMERPRLLQSLGSCQSCLLVQSTDHLVLNYFLAVSSTPPEISQTICHGRRSVGTLEGTVQ